MLPYNINTLDLLGREMFFVTSHTAYFLNKWERQEAEIVNYETISETVRPLNKIAHVTCNSNVQTPAAHPFQDRLP